MTFALEILLPSMNAADKANEGSYKEKQKSRAFDAALKSSRQGSAVPRVSTLEQIANKFTGKSIAKSGVEEGSGKISRATAGAVLVSAAFACIACNVRLLTPDVALGLNSVVSTGNVLVENYLGLPVYMLLGVWCGAVATLFRYFSKTATAFYAGGIESFKFMGKLQPEQRPILASMVCGTVAAFRPETLFEGSALFKRLLEGSFGAIDPSALVSLLLLKLLLTAQCVGGGLMGGIFAPSLFFGAAAGALFDVAASAVGIVTGGSCVCAALGAAACLSSVFRAPITGVVLLFEMTRSYYIVLPMLVTVAFATYTIDALEKSGSDTTWGWTGLGSDDSLQKIAAIAGAADMPMDELKKAFDAGATYCIYWKVVDNEYRAATTYTTPARLAALRKTRGDDRTFATQSADYTFPATGDGPVATCFRTKSEITIMDIGPDTKMKRRSLAMEFGIGNVHFIPCESGVLEYGTGRGG